MKRVSHSVKRSKKAIHSSFTSTSYTVNPIEQWVDDSWLSILKGFCRDTLSLLDSKSLDYIACWKILEAVSPQDAFSVLCGLERVSLTEYEGSATGLFVRRQLRAFSRRFYLSGSDQTSLQEIALQEFRDNQSRLEVFNSSDYLDSLPDDVKVVLNTAKLILFRSGLGDFSDQDLLDGLRMGPGASIGIGGSDTTLYRKFIEGPLSGSYDCIDFVSAALSSDPVLCQIIKTSGISFDAVSVSNGQFVPKKWNEVRFIATEPSLHMLVQQSIARHMTTCLRNLGINLETGQFTHRELARRGSIDGLLCTLDLRKASDSNSVALVQRQLDFAPGLLAGLMASRSEAVSVVIGETSTVIPLQCIATMGNAYTFPLQTLLYFSIVRACCPDGKVSAYGDDIVFPARYYPTVVRVLELVGLLVNQDKSFSTGNFRESCGGDYFHGCDVRPVSPDRPETLGKKGFVSWLCSFHNTLRDKLLNHGLPDDWVHTIEAFSYLFSPFHQKTGGKQWVNFVPSSYPDSSGITCDFHHIYSDDWLTLLDLPYTAYPLRVKRLADLPSLTSTARVSGSLSPNGPAAVSDWRFRFLVNVPKQRTIDSEDVYYAFSASRASYANSLEFALRGIWAASSASWLLGASRWLGLSPGPLLRPAFSRWLLRVAGGASSAPPVVRLVRRRGSPPSLVVSLRGSPCVSLSVGFASSGWPSGAPGWGGLVPSGVFAGGF
jgi:hypothetical protein